MGSNIVNSGQRLKRDKTQIMLLQNNNGILPQINNITNINIHIYQNMHNNHNLNNSVSYNKNKKLKGNIKVNSNKKAPITLPGEMMVDNNNMIRNNSTTNINNIDNSVKFLRDMTVDSSSFELFLQLIQCHIDIELLCDNIMGGHPPFRKKSGATLTNEMLFQLSTLLLSW